MFQIGEIKKWAKSHGVTVKKQGEGYVWFDSEQKSDDPEPLENVVMSIFNKVTNNKYVEHQKSYEPKDW